MQVRRGNAAGGADEADLLAAFDGVADGDLGEAHVEVAGHDAIAMIDVDDVAGEEEAVDQRHHAAIRGVDRVARGAAVIDAEVAAGDATVEDAARAEAARHLGLSRPRERFRPQLRRVLRPMTHGARELVFAFDTRFSLGIQTASEFGVDAKPARSSRACARWSRRWRLMRVLERKPQAVNAPD